MSQLSSTLPAGTDASLPLDEPLARLLSRLAALLGHAVAPHRFSSSLSQGLPPAGDAGLSAASLASELWLTRFPEGQARELEGDIGPDDLPALWVSDDGARTLLLRGRLAGGMILAEDVEGRVQELGEVALAAGTWLALRVNSDESAATRPSHEETRSRSAGDWFRHALWQRRRAFVEGGIATLAGNAFGLLTSIYSMQVYDRVVPTQGYSTLWVLTVGVLIAIMLELVMKQVRVRLVERACKEIDEELSSVFFSQALAIRMDQRPRTIGTFAAQIRQFDSVRSFMSSAALFVIADVPFAILFVAVIALIAGPVAIVPLVFIPISLACGFAFKGSIARHMAARVEESNYKNGLLVEAVDGIESVKAAGGEWKMLQRWRELTATMAAREMSLRDLSALSSSMSQTLQQVAYVAMIAAGAYAIGTGNLTVGGLIACSIISGRALSPIAQVSSLIVQWEHARVALQGLDGIMALARDEEPNERYVVPDQAAGQLRMDGVQFGYGDKPVLTIPELRIKPGERVAVLGAVGSGKSSLLKLLSGLYRPGEGRVLFDGIDVAQLAPEFVRQHVGYLPQDVRLFHGTLRDNLALGLPNPTDDQILSAARLTGLDRVIENHPRGLALAISEGGRGLSGGQRQLVGLTRLLLAKPKVLLLDEPTSSMDMQLELQLVQRVFSRPDIATTLVVATHKPAMLPHFTRVIIVDRGRIVADGPRDEILARMTAQPPARVDKAASGNLNSVSPT